MINSTSLDDLTPEAKALAEKLKTLADQAGVPIKFTSTYRDDEYQNMLYSYGRTVKNPNSSAADIARHPPYGSTVTKLKGGESIHNSRQAFDFVPVVNGVANYGTTGADLARWKKIGEIGESIGLVWGGSWTSFVDMPHFQLKGAKSGKKTSTPSSKPAVTQKPTDPAAPPKEPAPETKKAAEDPKIHKLKPLPNPLLAYPQYTYGISLAMLTPDEFNEIIKHQNYTPNRVIIASAGRYNNTLGPNQFVRSPFFNDDFYFEDLHIKTIIGATEQTRATNATEITFKIIEPYGMTFLNRIIELCSSPEVKSPNYTQQPYLLQIDFFASNDAGEIVGIVPNQTKRIPIRITKVDIKASNKGSEYECTAVVYVHSAYNLGTVQTPAHFEITAGTVVGFFQSNENEVLGDDINQQREAESSTKLRSDGTEGGGTIGPDGQITYVNSSLMSAQTKRIVASKDPVYKVKSYGSAINAWYAELERNKKVGVGDRYYFRFHPDLENAKFNLTHKLAHKDTAMADVSNTGDVRKGNTGAETAALSYNGRIWAINTGTTIDQVINFVMRNSDYIQDQLVVPEDFGADVKAYQEAKKKNENEPLNWFKIIPTIELKEYDKIRECWGRDITYNIIPYKIYNTKLSVAPQGVIENPLKVHNYYYTGANDDIIDFNIEFNQMYYNAVTAYRQNISSLYPGVITDAVADTTKNPDNYEGTAQNPNALMPVSEVPQTLDARARATGGDITNRGAAAVDVEQSIYGSTEAQMLTITMNIIGDPQYIKQDELFYAPEMSNTVKEVDTFNIDPRLIANGSMRMDVGEVYVQVTFRSPVDIDDETGLMRFEAKYKQSLFSGMYRVNTVENTFSGGKFTQNIELFRLPRQTQFDYVNAPKKTTSERTVDAPEAQLPAKIDTTPAPPTNKNATADSAAPASNPVVEKDPPVQTTEQKDLAAVAASAPEKPIDKASEPVPNPPPAGPSPEKLALQQQLADLKKSNSVVKSKFDSANTNVEQLKEQIDRIQANESRMADRVARGVISQEKADQLSAENKASIEFKTNLLNRDQATVLELQPQVFEASQAEKALQAKIDAAV